jgi:hypothetical protein
MSKTIDKLRARQAAARAKPPARIAHWQIVAAKTYRFESLEDAINAMKFALHLGSDDPGRVERLDGAPLLFDELADVNAVREAYGHPPQETP